jgi:hypothetical protein
MTFAGGFDGRIYERASAGIPGMKKPRRRISAWLASRSADARPRESIEMGLLYGRVIVCCDLSPVDHVPDGLEVVRTAVLVVQIVGVFPDINAQDWRAFATGDGLAHERAVLVGGGGDAQLLVGADDQPGPAAAEARGTGLFHLGFQLVETAESGIDRIGELAGRSGTA